jgi:DNA replication protein DnaC
VKPLASFLTDSRFVPPVIPEERQREFAAAEKREVERVRLARLDRAHIPQKYRSADIKLCDEKVQSYLENYMSGNDGGLVLRGDIGRGKTYSACAILMALYQDFPVRFATMLDILSDIRSTFRGLETEAAVFGRYTNVRLLVIDDIGKENHTDWALGMMFQIIDDRYRRGKPTIYTTQYRSIELAKRLASNGDEGSAAAIVSRMGQNQAILLTGEDRRRIR